MTVLRRRHENGMAVSNPADPTYYQNQKRYTDISQHDLIEAVRDTLRLLPDAGETLVIGKLFLQG